ncbi:MAG: DUF1566 domain-containing protein [Candidatus Brocadia sp.]|nr:MAG: DUF1566 domain-containing protein [Candidatus Brocadia sp.]
MNRFTSMQSGHYWSFTTYAVLTSSAWGVLFSGGNVCHHITKSESLYVRCVRGGHGHDGQ